MNFSTLCFGVFFVSITQQEIPKNTQNTQNTMKKGIIIVSILLGYLLNSTAQQGVQIGDIYVIATEMTEAQRNAIASPATGLLIFQTDGTMGLYYYSGSAWTPVHTGTPVPGPCSISGTIVGSNVTVNGFSDGVVSLSCLLYTSDAADDMQCVDLGGRRIIK